MSQPIPNVATSMVTSANPPVPEAAPAPAAPVVAGVDPAQFHGASTPGAGTDAPPSPAPAPVPAAPAAAAAGGEGDSTFSAKYVQGLREEAADNRVKLRALEESVPAQITQAVQEAVERTKTELTQTWAKALGVAPSEDQAPPDPAALLAQAQNSLTQAEADAAAERAAHRQTQVANAVLRASEVLGAQGDRLLDSSSFMSEVAGLDPAAGDFAAQVAAKINARVTADPTYGRAQAPVLAPRSGADMSAGNADTSRDVPPDVDSLRKQRSERRGRNGRGRIGSSTGASTPMSAEWAAFFNQQ